MENENEICGVCFAFYDSADHIPRVLINCGHTLCACCLIEILKSPQLRKCPYDNLEFKRSQKCLENFPVNFALSALLEGKNRNICRIHGERLVMFCLQDKVKLCYGCAFLGEHQGHSLKMISDLKAQGMKTKKYLEESLMKFEKNQFEKDQKVNLLKEDFLSRMGKKCEDIKDMLKIKEVEWTKEIANLLKRNIRNDNRLLLKKETEKTLEEINQACKKEDANLAILEQDFSSIIPRLQPGEKEEAFKLSEETSRVMDCIDSFLVNQERSIRNFDFSHDRMKSEELVIKKEEPEQEQLSSIVRETQKSSTIKTETRFTLETSGDSLFVERKNPISINAKADLDELNQVKRVKIELEQYDFLSSDPSDLNFLSETLDQLNNCTSMVMKFTSLGLNDRHVFTIFDHLFCRIQQLTDLEIAFGYEYFGKYQVTDKVIEFFCTSILSKAASLRNLTLKLDCSLITNQSLFALAKSLYPLSKNLESFKLGVGNTVITDKGIERIFNVILGVKALDLNLKGTFITDQSLMVLENHMIYCMKNLKKFSLDLSETKITIEGVSAIFAGIPKGISWLNLDFSRVALPYEVVFLFEKMVCSKLESVEDVKVRLEDRYLALKISKILETVRKDAAKRSRIHKFSQGNHC